MKFEKDPKSPPLTTSLCTSFEKEHSLTLPDDYKYFLCNTLNGGSLSCKKTSIALPNNDATPINNFFGIDAHETFNINEKMWILGDEDLPADMIPIANDPGGNFFFLKTSTEDAGKVFFYDHEMESNDPPTADNNPSLTVVANSFTEFLDSIECIEI